MAKRDALQGNFSLTPCIRKCQWQKRTNPPLMGALPLLVLD